MGITLQIQSVLFKNEKSSLQRALSSVANALRIGKDESLGLDRVTVVYGDASPEPVFDSAEINELSDQYAESFVFDYRFFDENTGTAKGHNAMGEKCDSDYMMVMNPDVLLSPRFFIEVFDVFSRKKDVGLVEARQTPIEHPKEYDADSGETSWASTAAAVFPSEVFRSLEGFDANTFFMYCDDVDFSWRVRLLGKRVIYCSNATVFHAKRPYIDGAWSSTSAEIYYSAEAAMLLAHKWSNEKRSEFLCRMFADSPDPVCNKAANEYLRRKREGLLAPQLDRQHKIATFVDDNYARHRFIM